VTTPWDRPGQANPQLLWAAYVCAIAAGAFILLAARASSKRERELIAIAKDAERDLRRSRDAHREELGAVEERRPGLPTDTLVIVTMQGYLCPDGLDHPAGSKSSERAAAAAEIGAEVPVTVCAACDRYLEHYDRS
jgi:peptidoglycan/xylan/chitin deacetylase (PgdA/CDA1 family)